MSDLQSKFGSGMNKLQEGIEQGKMKLQVGSRGCAIKENYARETTGENGNFAGTWSNGLYATPQ